MDNYCFNCGASGHKNYECPHPKTSGSAVIKKKLKKDFRTQNPNQQQINMQRYLNKQDQLKNVIKEGETTPTPVR